jgi:NADP-dependent 3-hydroxy acid dehydrogenase YdfG
MDYAANEADGRLRGRVAIVTGAGRGIGRAICVALTKEGASVVGAARTQSELNETAEECRGNRGQVFPVKIDLRAAEEIRNLVSRTLSEHHKVDILVNNAGIGVFKPVTETTVEDLDAMWHVNLRAVFLTCKEVLPEMIRANEGCIINIGSLAGKNSVRNGAVYSATKWGLRGFASSLMLEVRDHHVRVVTIFPGSVETGFSAERRKARNITKPEDVAAAVVFAATANPRTMVSEIDLRPTKPE